MKEEPWVKYRIEDVKSGQTWIADINSPHLSDAIHGLQLDGHLSFKPYEVREHATMGNYVIVGFYEPVPMEGIPETPPVIFRVTVEKE